MQTTTPNKFQILILGCGEIARYLARLAISVENPVTVCNPEVNQHPWPEPVKLYSLNYAASPWPLPNNTHAVIARGHQGDAESVISLFQHHARHIYLIASARRATSVIAEVAKEVNETDLLPYLSAPAGLNLGGNHSAEIAMSLLAEIQWRHYGTQLQPLTELRQQRSQRKPNHRNETCPGRRP